MKYKNDMATKIVSASVSFTGHRVPFVTSLAKEGGTKSENNCVWQSDRHRDTTYIFI